MKPKLLLGVALIFMSLVNSNAQPLLQYIESLDAMVVKAPLIFRGYFSDDTCSITSRDGLFKYTLTVRVEEVLKGHPPAPLELTADIYSYETNDIKQWVGGHTEQLFIINATKPTRWRVICLDAAHPGRFFGLAIQPPITLMGSTELTNPAEILAYTRKITRQPSHPPNTFWLNDGWVYLDVPVTPELENRALQLIRSNHWPSLEEGIKALGCFKSAKNIQLLKPLLNDSNYAEFLDPDRPWMSQRIHYPRKAAYDVLTNWGVNVSEPVWKEDLPWHYDPTARQPLEVQIPFGLSADRIGPLGDNIGIGSRFQTDEWTNLVVGSNMITGARIEWFVYPDSQPKPSKPTDIQQYCQPRLPSDYFNRARGDSLPEAGKKYLVEMNYVLFETDNAPTNLDEWGQIRTDIWRPQDGKAYRVLVEKTLRTTFGP